MADSKNTQTEQLLETTVNTSFFLKGKALNDFNKWLWKYVNKKEKQNISENTFFDWFNNCDSIIRNAYMFTWFDLIGFHIGRDMVDNYWLENSTFFERLEMNGYDYISTIKTIDDAFEKAMVIYNNYFSGRTQNEC